MTYRYSFHLSVFGDVWRITEKPTIVICTITNVCTVLWEHKSIREGFWEDVILELNLMYVQFREQLLQRHGGRRKYGTLELLQKFQCGRRKDVCGYEADFLCGAEAF